MKPYLLIVLLLITPIITYAQGIEASRLRKTVFANLGTPSGSNIRDCTDCGIAANGTCASGGTGATATRRNGAWYCSTGGTAGAAGTVTTTGSPASPQLAGFSSSTVITTATATEVGTTLDCADAGSTDAYVCTASPVPSSLTKLSLVFTPNTSNTGAATLNVNSLGVKNIKVADGSSLRDPNDGDLRASRRYLLSYDGTQWLIMSTLGNAAASGTTINSTDGVLPYRSSATVFGDSPVARVDANTVSFTGTAQISKSGTYGVYGNTSGTAAISIGPAAVFYNSTDSHNWQINGGGVWTMTATTFTGAAGTSLVAPNATFTALASDATHTDNTVCVDTSSGVLYKGSATLGICLGTSSARFKHGIQPLGSNLRQMMALRPVSFFYNKGYGDSGARRQYGFTAEDVSKVAPELVGLDAKGQPNSVDLLAMVPKIISAMQEQQKEINTLKSLVASQQRTIRRLRHKR